MHNPYVIKNHSVHLWQVLLPDFFEQAPALFDLLSDDEKVRALRFQQPLHQQRFTITRGLLRKTLSLYTGIPPEQIVFTYGPYGKPYLSTNSLNIQFNVSHSADFAVYAVTINQEIGIDIEKVQNSFNEAIAKRFFSANEISELFALPKPSQVQAFYQIWAGKEALIKTLGQGLFVPLSDFSVSLQKPDEPITISHDKNQYTYHLQYFSVHDDYQAAFASEKTIDSIVRWQWDISGPLMVNYL